MLINRYVGVRAGGQALAEEALPGEVIVAPVSADDDVLRVEHIAKSFGPVPHYATSACTEEARCSACSATTAPAVHADQDDLWLPKAGFRPDVAQGPAV